LPSDPWGRGGGKKNLKIEVVAEGGKNRGGGSGTKEPVVLPIRG